LHQIGIFGADYKYLKCFVMPQAVTIHSKEGIKKAVFKK
jgi:hypothetical protein